MTVKELKSAISKYPDDMEVCVRDNNFGWQPINIISIDERNAFSHSKNKRVWVDILGVAHVGDADLESK